MRLDLASLASDPMAWGGILFLAGGLSAAVLENFDFRNRRARELLAALESAPPEWFSDEERERLRRAAWTSGYRHKIPEEWSPLGEAVREPERSRAAPEVRASLLAYRGALESWPRWNRRAWAAGLVGIGLLALGRVGGLKS